MNYVDHKHEHNDTDDEDKTVGKSLKIIIR